MARSPVATDNFNRASLGTDWAQLNTGWGSITIYSSTSIDSSGSGGLDQGAVARWVGAGSFADDQYSSLVYIYGSWSNVYIGVIGRGSADTGANRDYYFANFYENNFSGTAYTTTIEKIVNGSRTNLASTTYAWADGERLEIECEGTTIRSLHDGTELSSTTDSAIATGAPGVWMSSGGSSATRGDDWVGGSITGGGGVTVPALDEGMLVGGMMPLGGGLE